MDVGDKALEIEERLDHLAKLIERVKILYEQYFMGIQKIAPVQLHHDAERGIRELTQINIRNTALRFRFNTLCQKFGSYNSYWRRIMREIEQGRYIRDISRVKRRAERLGQDIPEEILAAMPKRMRDRIERDRAGLAKRVKREAEREAEGDAESGFEPVASEPALIVNERPAVYEIDAEDPMLDDDLDLDQMFAAIQDDAARAVSTPEPAPPAKPAPAARSAPAPRPAAPRPTRSAPKPAPVKPAAPEPAAAKPGPGGMSERQTRDLFDRYVQARKLVGEATANLTYDKMVRTLEKQATQIMKQHKAKSVDFNVVLKDDKVILKAKPRK